MGVDLDDEIEVIRNIFYREFIDTCTDEPSFALLLRPEAVPELNPDEWTYVSATWIFYIVFEFSSLYPTHAGPKISVQNSIPPGALINGVLVEEIKEMVPFNEDLAAQASAEDLSQFRASLAASELAAFLNDKAESLIGTGPMIYELVADLPDKIEAMLNARKSSKQRSLSCDLSEMKKFSGTRVTKESFLQWKTQFDAEFASPQKTSAKLTGKQIFESDKKMAASDVAFLANEDNPSSLNMMDT